MQPTKTAMANDLMLSLRQKSTKPLYVVHLDAPCRCAFACSANAPLQSASRHAMQPLRYVVLHHTGGTESSHFDLMFETLPGSMLATWRSETWPIELPVQLTRLRDHRRLYLEYEGDLADHRGRVYRVAEGNCEVEVGADAVWTIRLLSGISPQSLVFTRLDAGAWRVEPA